MSLHNYTILSELGEGGMGKVYLAQHLHTGRLAVIKTLLPQYAQNETLVRRFYAEAQILAELDHPAIVRLYDFTIYEGVPYLIMEYVEGTPLEKIFEQDGIHPLGLKWAYEYLAPIFQALAYTHAKDIIHRDIKPSNIMILWDGRAKLLDFGIAKAMDADYKLTQTGMQIGTVLYMAPEQIRGEKVTKRADLYAMGLILYQCAFGRYPWEWQGKTQFQIYQTILTELPPIPAYAPLEMRAFFERALAKDPRDRFHSANEMLSTLKEVAYPQAKTAQNQSERATFHPSPPVQKSAQRPPPQSSKPAHQPGASPTSSPKIKVEALDSPPTYTRESLSTEHSESKSQGIPLLPELLYASIGLIAAAFLHKPLGVWGWILWTFAVGGGLYSLLGRGGTSLFLASGAVGGILGYFYLYAYPKAQQNYEDDKAIYTDLLGEVERYRADSLPTILMKKGMPRSELRIEIEPLDPPEGGSQETVSLAEAIQILKGRVRRKYPEKGVIRLDLRASGTVQKPGQRFSKTISCQSRCGIFGDRICYGTRTIWYIASWKESCTTKGALLLTYEYEEADRRLTCRFAVEVTKPKCREIEGTRSVRPEYEGPCLY